MKKTMFLFYGIVSYALFFGSYCYAVGFVTNLLVPSGLDSTPQVSIGKAVAINIGLLVAFALQHSVMARPGFKKWWTTIVPEPIERSTYVLLSSICMVALFIYWQPMGGVIWSFETGATYWLFQSLSLLGFGIVLVSTFLINHFDLFGLRQVWLYFTGKPYTQLKFRTPFFYKYVRHPLYLGWMIAFWAAPVMTAAHFLFAAICSAYMLTAIQFEERDLITSFGEQYTRYKLRAPMLIPFSKKVNHNRNSRA
jgi:protein-S-isoprenylcysteine O-methyltransferase Ste14